MATLWNDVYLQVCEALLESGGLQLGIFTPDEFQVLGVEILTDFLDKTSIIKKIFNVVMSFSVPVYSKSGLLGDLVLLLANQTHLYESSGFYIDNTNPGWHNFADANQFPDRYRQDELAPRSVELYPTPNVQGNQISAVGGVGGYGVIASTTLAVDFDLALSYQTPLGGYGVISGISGGNPYVEAGNPGYGMMSHMVPSTSNLCMLGSALPFNQTKIFLTNYVELLPDSFVPYLKYGILARIYSTDSEVKDMQKAAYCQARYAEGVNLGSAMMSDEYTEEG